MRTTYTAVKPLEPGKPVDVVERDESGALVGAWHGYWSFRRGTVALYPNPKNRYVAWPNGELPKKRIVSDREVTVKNAECRMQNAELTTPHPSAELTPSPPDKGEGCGGVQQQMKFY